MSISHLLKVASNAPREKLLRREDGLPAGTPGTVNVSAIRVFDVKAVLRIG